MYVSTYIHTYKVSNIYIYIICTYARTNTRHGENRVPTWPQTEGRGNFRCYTLRQTPFKPRRANNMQWLVAKNKNTKKKNQHSIITLLITVLKFTLSPKLRTTRLILATYFGSAINATRTHLIAGIASLIFIHPSFLKPIPKINTNSNPDVLCKVPTIKSFCQHGNSVTLSNKQNFALLSLLLL